MAPNGLGTPVLCCFLPNYLHPSISALPSVCSWLPVPFVFCPCASIICKIYVSLSILSFDQSGVGIGKICNSLSILFLSYLSANVFHLGFSISMSMRSIRLSKPIERSLLAIETARSVCRSKQSLFFCLGTQGEASFGDGVGLVNADFDVYFQELSNLWLFA